MMTKTALIIVDMQNDFVSADGALCVDGAKATVPAIAELISHGRKQEWCIIYIIREHRASGVDVDKPRARLFEKGCSGYCTPGSWGAQIVDGIKPEEGYIIITKYRNSAFFQTNLDMVLRRMKVETVVICGTQYPNCIRATANDAMSYDYDTIVCTDATSAKAQEVAEANIYDMRNMGIRCLSIQEIKDWG